MSSAASDPRRITPSENQQTAALLGYRSAAKAPQVERDVVTVRAQLDYPNREHSDYIAALESLDRLARKAHEADQLLAQHEMCGGKS